MEDADPFRPFTSTEDAGTDHVQDDWTPILPVPSDAPTLDGDLIARWARLGFTFSRRWDYLSAAGDLMTVVVRYDRVVDGTVVQKEIRPFTYGHGSDRVRRWQSKAIPSKRPLYRLNALARQPEASVLVVEGEKAADAAQARFPDHVVTTSSSGAQAAAKTEWTPLAGRQVTIWPDRDKAGTAYAEDVLLLLQEAGAASVAIVAVPSAWPEGWDLADPLPPDVGEETLYRLLEQATVQQPEAGSWANPDLSLLGTGRRQAPAFPLTLLGNFWADWVRRRAAAASAPVDYVAVALLTSVGAALANVRWPSAGAGWSEPPILWCGLVGSPSSGKSPAMDAAFALLHHAEEALAAGYDDARREHETKQQVAKATRETWEADVKAAIKERKQPPPLPSNAEVEELPPRPRIRIADATIEAMAKLASALPRGLLLVRDELAGWLGSFDRYGGSGTDRAFALEMWGGRDYVVDRVKNPVPIRIVHLSIGVLGSVQPDKLSVVLEGPDDGLAARLLWTWPDVVPDFVLARETIPDAPAAHAFTRLIDLEMAVSAFGAVPQPVKLPLVPDAEARLEQFARELAHHCHEASGLLAGTLGKARGHALRLSAIVEHLWWCARGGPAPETISSDATLVAIALVDSGGRKRPSLSKVNRRQSGKSTAFVMSASKAPLPMHRDWARSGRYAFESLSLCAQIVHLVLTAETERNYPARAKGSEGLT